MMNSRRDAREAGTDGILHRNADRVRWLKSVYMHRLYRSAGRRLSTGLPLTGKFKWIVGAIFVVWFIGPELHAFSYDLRPVEVPRSLARLGFTSALATQTLAADLASVQTRAIGYPLQQCPVLPTIR